MNGIKRRNIYGLLPMIMIALASCLLQSCFNDDDYDECGTTSTGSGRAAVQLHITTDGITDLNATRADEEGTTDPGDPGEFMNTLCIFIVDAGTGVIEKKLQPDLSGTVAASGNLEDYTSDVVWLTIGDKNIYAFANWDNTESTEWNNVIDKVEGDTITSDTLSFTVSDPASKVDIDNGKYIPMSGKLENVTIKENDMNTSDNMEINDETVTNNLISVGLDRLVGKVTVTIVSDTTDIKVGKIYFGGTADNVSLYPIGSIKDYGVSWSDITFGEINKTVEKGITPTVKTVEANSGDVKISSFYINESYRTESTDQDTNEKNIKDSGYTLTLDMENNSKYDMYDGSKYKATTVRKEVPRNNIYPIKLQFDTYDVQFEIKAWTSPLESSTEYEYTTDAKWHESEGYYKISLRDITSRFEITPTLYKVSNVDGETTETAISNDVITWQWIQSTADEYDLSQTNEGVLTITQLTAMAGYSYSFNLEVKWTTTLESGATVEHERTYKVKVELTEGDFTIGDEKYQLKKAP